MLDEFVVLRLLVVRKPSANFLKEPAALVGHHEDTRGCNQHQSLDMLRKLGRVHSRQEPPERMTHEDKLVLAENPADALDVGHLGADAEGAFQLLHVRVKVL